MWLKIFILFGIFGRFVQGNGKKVEIRTEDGIPSITEIHLIEGDSVNLKINLVGPDDFHKPYYKCKITFTPHFGFKTRTTEIGSVALL